MKDLIKIVSHKSTLMTVVVQQPVEGEGLHIGFELTGRLIKSIGEGHHPIANFLKKET